MSMKPAQLLQICLITSRFHPLFNDKRLNNIVSVLYSRRSFTRRTRHRRAILSPATPFQNQRSIENFTAQLLYSRSPHKVINPFTGANMSRGLQESALSLDAVLTSPLKMATGVHSISYSTNGSYSGQVPTSPRANHLESAGESGAADGDGDAYSSSMPSPPSLSEISRTRSTRSTSTTSRNSNRLSLTLPIAPPDSVPSRPTPTSSVPPTPGPVSGLSSPIDANDFIIAIAAQERRVLELREELGRAEHDLRRLKKQWTASDGYKKRAAAKNFDPLRAASVIDGPWAHDDPTTVRYTSELERRKAILLAQSRAAPRDTKRTIIRGGHTRALSLLSPTTSPNGNDPLRSPDLYSKPSPVSTPLLSKRATWAPRQSQPTHGMKQIANDFKQGLWTFVEDLRQATVGDEAISGTTNRTSDMVSRLNRTETEQDTIRASTSSRGKMPFQDESDSATEAPNRSSTSSFSDRLQHRRSTSKVEPKARKHYSWTPLPLDSLCDDDCSNWDILNAKPSRWSGSTVNGDDNAIPEKFGGSEETLRHKQSHSEIRSPSPETPSRLEELPQAILNKLTPSNIKNTTSNFIKEWEKSLSPPADSTSS
ncbi:uncharacterized protein F4812DRAFT_433660 [Daldinia caldariorum]|uniref:uncharacterized protein n=1 Tax=Daldinia caldariorum TaxID=326644 RepID=UPI002008A8EC|nr:uncharacterized protein F4812DRAFT_433660 [Daldinia caldariorum]KAI1466320.1 hypothetical protein F4812DRAFT_433660 [Daldinia caldariorum]